jgi:MFS family permease
VAFSNRSDRTSFEIPQGILDLMQKVFFVGLIASVALFGYLIYGLFTGQMADAVGKTEMQHGTELVTQLSFYLNISLLLTMVAAAVLFYEAETTGLVLLLIAAFMAYGLQFCGDMLFASDAHRLTDGPLSKLTMQEIQSAAYIIGAPGALLFVRSLFVRIMEGRRGPDLAKLQFGSKAQREEVPRALIGAVAKCWQLPFCREAIRAKCPIFLGRTKCWKERVG